MSLISRGHLSKAVNRMTSFGVASMEDSSTLEALKSKYPPRSEQIQSHVVKGQAVETLQNLRDAFLELQSGVAPGTGQLKPEYLKCLGEVWEEGNPHWNMLEAFALRYVNGVLPAWYFKCSLTVETVGLFKTAEQDPVAIRPVGMRNPFTKVIHKEVMKQNAEAIRNFLEPQQLGMSKAGGVKLVHCVRMKLEERPDFICIKLDFRNAFN